MIPSFPSSLRQEPRRRDWTGGAQNVLHQFEAEDGPPIVRPRVTGETAVFSAVFPNLSDAQRATFEAWFRNDLRRGALAFAWRDPVDGTVGRWRIVPDTLAYSFTSKGAGWHDLSLTLMRLPGTPWWAPYVLAGTTRVPHVVADYANAVFGVDSVKTAASAVALVAGIFDLYTTDGTTTEELAKTVLAGDIPATAPGTVTKIVGYIPI